MPNTSARFTTLRHRADSVIIRKATEILKLLLGDIQRRFEKVNERPTDKKTSPEAMNMLSSSGLPLYTALILLRCSSHNRGILVFRVPTNALSAPILLQWLSNMNK